MSRFTRFGEKNSYYGPKIAIVIPTLNEEEGIGLVMDGIGKALHHYNHTVLVVDGYSKDRTVEIAKERGASVIYQRGSGYGDALMTGFEYASNNLKADVVVMMDADGTYDPHDVPALLKPVLEDRADFVIGNRFQGMKRRAMTFVNRIGNKMLSSIARRTLRLKISDTQCGLRALRASLLRNLSLRTEGMSFAIEMLAEAKQVKARVLEVPIAYNQRVGNTKLSPIRDGMRIFGTILRLIRDYQPLLFFGSFGFLLALIGALIGVNIVITWVQTGHVTRLASVTLSSMLIIAGLFIFTIGLLADMIKDLRRELKRKME